MIEIGMREGNKKGPFLNDGLRYCQAYSRRSPS